MGARHGEGWILELYRGEVLVDVVRKGTAFAVCTTAGEARALGTFLFRFLFTFYSHLCNTSVEVLYYQDVGGIIGMFSIYS